MKQLILPLCLLFFILSCKTTGYKFTEEFSGRKKEVLYQNLVSKPLFPGQGRIRGFFIDKKNTHNFVLIYDMDNEYFDLRLYPLTGYELQLHCTLERGIITFKEFSDFFISGKGTKIIEFLNYLVAVYPKMDYIYRTADGYYIITNGKDYYKYDEKEIVKKENKSYTVQYRYTENKKIDIIHFSHRGKRYIFKIHSIGERIE